jgi:signal transduction histidine kinase
VEGPGNDLPIFTDRVKVEQIIGHLIENAVKYSAETAEVRVRITAGESTVQLDVVDQGIGIYSGDLERIFDPFTQVDSTSTREFGGTGIGLYVCHTLAETLGGRIDVESVLAKGSTFSVTLPRKSIDPQGS